MPFDPLDMKIAVVKKEFAENAIRMYKQSGFTEEECVDTVAKQFKIGKKVTREIVRKIYQEKA